MRGGQRVTTAIVAVAVLVVAVVAGGLIGYAVGRPGATPHPVELAAAAPMPASPSVPIDPVKPYAPDIDYPPLSTDLTYRRHRITAAGHTWSYEAPAGWKRYPGSGDEIGPHWRPRGEPTVGGYGLRVLPVSARLTPGNQMSAQTDNMSALADERVDKIRGNTVWYEYRSGDNRHRLDDFAWVVLPGSPYAGFELSVFGREADRAGLDDLLATVRDSVRLVR